MVISELSEFVKVDMIIKTFNNDLLMATNQLNVFPASTGYA